MRSLVRVPASTSNLGPGFDCLGLALDLHLEIEVETLPQGLWIDVGGQHAAGVPVDAGNLVHACICRALRRAGRPIPGLRLHIHNDIPLGRGLGSSAAAILAGLVAGTLLATEGDPPEASDILHAAAEIEGHPDNAGAALLGGLVASVVDPGGVRALRIPFPEQLTIVLVLPEHEVRTDSARSILPDQVSRADAVFNLSHLALFLGALQAGDFATLRTAMQDRLHQTLRLGLVPGLADALELLAAEPGCAGAAISGSGPTLLGLFPAPSPTAGEGAVACLAAHGIDATLMRLHPDLQGLWWDARA